MSNSPYKPPTTSDPEASVTAFAPLPLRARGVLENIDLAFKLFKQYWKPLLGWAALTNVLMLFASYFALFVSPPLIIAPTCCVLAAALRGQSISFKGCWGFTQPRLWNLLAVHIVSMLAVFLVVGILSVGVVLLSVQVGPDISNSVVASFILIALAVLAVGFVLAVMMAWQGMVGMVACMEDEFRNSGAFKRAWVLLRGRWKAAIGLLTVLNLALIVLYGVLYGVLGLVLGLNDISRAFQGGGDGLAILGKLGAITISSWLLFTLFMPIMYLAQALFYLDARVRNEALDLEWNAHLTAHNTRSNSVQPEPSAVDIAPQSFFERVEAPLSTSLSAPPNSSGSTSTWASPDSAPSQISLDKPAVGSEETARDDNSSRFVPR